MTTEGKAVAAGRLARARASRPQRPHPHHAGRRQRAGRSVQVFLFFVPGIVVYTYFAWWPILRSVLLSLQKTNLVDPARWVGLENFTDLFADPLLFTAVRNTAWFALLGLVFGFPAPVILATFMGELRRLGGMFRVLIYLPVALPPVVAVLLWKWFYDPGNGLFNTLLAMIGLGPFPWLEDASWAMPSLVAQSIWAGAGGAVLIYLAALTGVPSELYDAAEADGASILRRVWHITLPQMRGVLLILLLLQVIGTMQVFVEPYVMTDGGPENATVTVLLLIFRYAFVYGQYGMAAALSVLLAIVLGALSALYLRATRSWSTG